MSTWHLTSSNLMSGINRKLIIIGKWSINSRFMNYTRHSRHDEQVKLSYIEKLLWSFICCLFICTFVKVCMRCTILEVSGYIILDTHCEELIGGHQSPFHTLFNVWSGHPLLIIGPWLMTRVSVSHLYWIFCLLMLVLMDYVSVREYQQCILNPCCQNMILLSSIQTGQ